MAVHIKLVTEPPNAKLKITAFPESMPYEVEIITRADEGNRIASGTVINIPEGGSVTLYYPGTNWERVCNGGGVYTITYDSSPPPSGGPVKPPELKINIRVKPRSHEVFLDASLGTVLDLLSQFLDQQKLAPEALESLQGQFIEPLLNTVGTFRPEVRQTLGDRLIAPEGLLTRFGTLQQQHRVKELNDG